MSDQQIGLLSDLILYAVPVMLAVRFVPWSWLTPLVKRLIGGATLSPTVSDGSPTIEEAYAALGVVERWGADKVPAFAEGTRLIRDHWLQSAAPKTEANVEAV